MGFISWVAKKEQAMRRDALAGCPGEMVQTRARNCPDPTVDETEAKERFYLRLFECFSWL